MSNLCSFLLDRYYENKIGLPSKDNIFEVWRQPLDPISIWSNLETHQYLLMAQTPDSLL